MKTSSDPSGGFGEFGPWPYATGLMLWFVYVAAWIGGVPLWWRLPLGLVAAVLWGFGLVARRKSRRGAGLP